MKRISVHSFHHIHRVGPDGQLLFEIVAQVIEKGPANDDKDIQLAFRDVSDALIGYQKLHQVRVAQETTVKDLQDTVDTSPHYLYRGPAVNPWSETRR